MQDQSQSMYGDNSKINQDLWNQFVTFQGPAMQSLISTYMDQSRTMFLQMQQQLQNQTRNMPLVALVEDGDYALYRDLLAERCRQAGVAVWAYCLMPSHVHLILAPSTADAGARRDARGHSGSRRCWRR